MKKWTSTPPAILFWLNSGAGLMLAIAFVASGSLLARFYRNPLVANVAAGLSAGIFIAAASAIHLALLKRAMRFAGPPPTMSSAVW